MKILFFCTGVRKNSPEFCEETSSSVVSQRSLSRRVRAPPGSFLCGSEAFCGKESFPCLERILFTAWNRGENPPSDEAVLAPRESADVCRVVVVVVLPFKRKRSRSRRKEESSVCPPLCRYVFFAFFDGAGSLRKADFCYFSSAARCRARSGLFLCKATTSKSTSFFSHSFPPLGFPSAASRFSQRLITFFSPREPSCSQARRLPVEVVTLTAFFRGNPPSTGVAVCAPQFRARGLFFSPEFPPLAS